MESEKNPGRENNGHKDHSSSSLVSTSKGGSEDPKPFTEKDLELGPLHDYNAIILHHTQGDRLSRIESNPTLSRQLTRRMLKMPESTEEAYDEDVARAWGDNRAFPPPLPDKDAYCVTFNGPDDPYSPRNYPASKSSFIALQRGFQPCTFHLDPLTFHKEIKRLWNYFMLEKQLQHWLPRFMF